MENRQELLPARPNVNSGLLNPAFADFCAAVDIFVVLLYWFTCTIGLSGCWMGLLPEGD